MNWKPLQFDNGKHSEYTLFCNYGRWKCHHYTLEPESKTQYMAVIKSRKKGSINFSSPCLRASTEQDLINQIDKIEKRKAT